MEQRIVLKFPKDLSKLAGNTFGRNTYENQVKGKIDLSEKTIFVFPTGIDRIASSFVQGFFDSLVSEIGISGIEEQIYFESSIPNIKEFVLENLE